MPLDPFFAERLRVHRRYLIGQALGGLRARFTRAAAAPGSAGTQPAETRPAAAKPAATPSARRARHRRSALAWDRTELRSVGTPGPDLRTAEHTVEVSGYPAVRVRIYYPDGSDAGPVPACLTFYGGAFRIGGIDYPTTDAANRRRAAEAGIAMVAVGYALAPEHRFPTQVEQAHAVLVWLHGHAQELGIDADRLGVAGVSAGGSIAASLAIVNRDRTGIPLRLQLLEVPVTDLTGRHLDLRATIALGIPSLIALRELRSIARTYLPRGSDARDPRASPLRAASHADLPEAFIFTAQYDPLRGDGEAYGARLRTAGVAASVVQYRGVTHDTPIYTGALPAARRWHDDVIAVLRHLHDGRSA